MKCRICKKKITFLRKLLAGYCQECEDERKDVVILQREDYNSLLESHKKLEELMEEHNAKN